MGLFAPSSKKKLQPDPIVFRNLLRMAHVRLKILISKKQNEIKRCKSEAAAVLQNVNSDGDTLELVSVRVEKILQIQYIVEGLEMFCISVEVLQNRVQQIFEVAFCPPPIKESLTTLIWCSKNMRDEIPELIRATEHIGQHYGAWFIEIALNNSECSLTPEIVARFSSFTPDHTALSCQMRAICDEFSVPWKKEWDNFRSKTVAIESALHNEFEKLPFPELVEDEYDARLLALSRQ